MYWHIDTDIISLLVVCALYICNNIVHPRQEKTLRDRRFAWCLRAGIAITVVDIAASLVMEVPASRFTYHFLMTLYYATVELVIVSWLYYVVAIIYMDDERRRRIVSAIAAVPYAIYVLLVLSNPWSGLFFALDAEGAYSRGPCFFLIVAVYFLYAAGLLILIVARRKHIPEGYPKIVLPLIPVIVAVAIVVQLLMPGWLVILPGYMVCLVLAFLFLQAVRAKGEHAMMQSLIDLAGHVSCGFAISFIDQSGKIEMRYLNDGYFAICEETREDLTGRYGEDILAGIHPDDREMARGSLEDMARNRRGHTMTYRFVTTTGKLKWLYVQVRVVNHPDGTATAYSTFTDLTEQMKLQRQMADVIHTVPCGICLYNWDGEKLHPLLANAQLSEILGVDAVGHLERIGGLDYALVHPEDAEEMKRASMEALRGSHEMDYTFRVRNATTGDYRWIRQRGRLVVQPDGARFVYVSYYDVTEEHLAEQRLRVSEQALEYATAQAGLWCWRYDAARDCVYPDERYRRAYGLPPVMENFLEDWLPKGIVHPEYIGVYRDACLRIKAGEQQAIFEARNYAEDGSEHWSRYCLTNLLNGEGKPAIAIGTSMVIDAEKELWAKYEMERRRRSMDSDNLLVYAVFNLTTGETMEYAFRDGAEVPRENRDIFAYSRENARLLIDEEERRQFLALNDVDTLLSRFARGETEFRLDYRRRLPGGEVAWVRSTLHLVRDPRSANILLFEYWYDIEEEKVFEQMYRSIASDNYDYVARINGQTKRFVSFSKAGLSYRMPPASGDDADAVTLTIYEEGVSPEDRELAIQNTLLANIKENLRRHGRFQFAYREIQPDGSIRHKRITQYYLDAQREIIIMTREDVTELIHAEAEKNEMLAAALEVANQASRAKSQFLSRVSHELRTPLNAIIGFVDLAKDADAKQMGAYLANADTAAKQLLNVINDVLDMSAIESGGMKIAHASFDIKRMVHSLTAIYLAQCRQKNLHYETRLLTPIDEWLVGDQLRVNQILLNLLNNAVKFTAEGHIRLDISQMDAPDDNVILRFAVSDTGCGMSEEMLSRLFKPFEQENATTAQRYGGNGLGLSIVYSLVHLMNGAIRVESRQGEGSTFTVDLPFARNEALIEANALSGVEALRALVVDDEAAELEYLSTVLTRIGVRHTCAAGGDEALAELARGAEAGDDYNVCLVDWRMPHVSGMETTRRIRDRYGKRVIVIVVSAYAQHETEERAKEAGANMFLPKPLFQSALFDLFATLTSGRAASKEGASIAMEFAGRRVLLAEDNAMNRLVAESLLRKKFHLECESAVDGQVAVDKFLASPKGYYDAILMDIQMPNLDGFAATRAIRASDHPDAKEIQIIALTANAFNEDVARTLSGGMNAHVAKPIEPGVLGLALKRAFAARAL